MNLDPTWPAQQRLDVIRILAGRLADKTPPRPSFADREWYAVLIFHLTSATATSLVQNTPDILRAVAACARTPQP